MPSKIEKIYTWSWTYFLEEICVITFANTDVLLRSRQVMSLIVLINFKLGFFIACLMAGLEYVHNKNIIHRDIKPENLVFDADGIQYFRS